MSGNIDFVQRIVTWLEDNQIFLRQKKSNEQRALRMLFYYAGLSWVFLWNAPKGKISGSLQLLIN